MNVAIVGSREFEDERIVHIAIERLINLHGRSNLTLISGGARGADQFAANAGVSLDVNIREHFPDWNRYGKSAGYRRNELIVRDADMLIAFFANGPRSRGTSHSVELARAKGIPVHIYHEGVWS